MGESRVETETFAHLDANKPGEVWQFVNSHRLKEDCLDVVVLIAWSDGRRYKGLLGGGMRPIRLADELLHREQFIEAPKTKGVGQFKCEIKALPDYQVEQMEML
tara:strand:+ start:1279 stop:1590 length:312 start_codon:yes stop_codon:yes gene_type:complete